MRNDAHLNRYVGDLCDVNATFHPSNSYSQLEILHRQNPAGSINTEVSNFKF